MLSVLLRIAVVAVLLSVPALCAAASSAAAERDSQVNHGQPSPIAVFLHHNTQSASVSASYRRQPQRSFHITPSLVRQREERQAARHNGVANRLTSVHLADPAPAQWFTQRLDHFDRSNATTWQQRYYVNASVWNGTGPVMFLFGHEREMTADLVGGTWVINWLAEQFGALIVCLEHRFYGASWPTDDTSLGFMQRYLSTEQALQDAAVWTAHIRQQYSVPDDSRWIVMGRSYGGTLAALFRLKFPHLVTGALATSGPLQAKVDYWEYNEVIGIALGDECSTALKHANDRVTALLSNSSGQAQLAKDFGFCKPLTSPLQYAELIQSWSGDIDGIVQYSIGNDTRDWCDAFLAADKDPYRALIDLYYPPSSECRQPFDYAAYVEESKQDATDMTWEWQVSNAQHAARHSPQHSTRATLAHSLLPFVLCRQTCSAYGWYQTGNSSHQPFSSFLDANFSLSFCRDVFDISADDVYAAVAETNDRNGGYNISASRVLYTNGELDPWSRAAITPPNRGGYDNVVYVIARASHCTDFMPPSDDDSDSLKKLRGIQVDTIAGWLSD